MWQVLGKDTLYVDMADAWKNGIVEALAKDQDCEKFKKLLDKTEVRYMLNGTTEVHTFFIEVPEKYTPKQIQFMADKVLSVAKEDLNRSFVSIDGQYQKCQVVITNDKEPELIGLNRTEGYGSGKIFMPILDSLTKPGKPNDSTFDY